MTLKKENYTWLNAYSIGQVLMFGMFSMQFDFSLVEIENLVKPGVISGLVYIMSIVLVGLIPESFKATLLFWKIRNPLPGCEAFSKHMYSDDRIDPEAIKSLVGNIPSKPKEQNQLWYKVYNKNADNPIILNSHREYLLTRDLTVLSFLFLVFLGIGSFFVFEHLTIIFRYCLFLAVLYLMTAFAGRNYGTRLVKNVLALECAQCGMAK